MDQGFPTRESTCGKHKLLEVKNTEGILEAARGDVWLRSSPPSDEQPVSHQKLQKTDGRERKHLKC